MKTAAIIRIAVGAVVALALTVLLTLALTGKTIFHRTGRQRANNEIAIASGSGNVSVAESNASEKKEGKSVSKQDDNTGKQAAAYASGNASIPMDQVREIKVEWTAGNVTLSAGTGDAVEFSETSVNPLKDDQTLRYTLTGGKLHITYCASTATLWNWLELDQLNMPRKDLDLVVPATLLEQLKELSVDTVSADLTAENLSLQELEAESIAGHINVAGITADKLSLQSVSGDINAQNIAVGELDTESISGRIEVTGSARKIDGEVTSGEIRILLSNTPQSMEFDAVSGDVQITLPANATDFTARMDSVSGDLTCDFPSVMRNGRFTVGTGMAEYDFESVSGDAMILAG